MKCLCRYTFCIFILARGDFCPSLAHLRELRVSARPGTPLLAATAIVTKEMKMDVIERLDMKRCEYICASSNKPNIMYHDCRKGSCIHR